MNITAKLVTTLTSMILALILMTFVGYAFTTDIIYTNEFNCDVVVNIVDLITLEKKLKY